MRYLSVAGGIAKGADEVREKEMTPKEVSSLGYVLGHMVKSHMTVIRNDGALQMLVRLPLCLGKIRAALRENRPFQNLGRYFYFMGTLLCIHYRYILYRAESYRKMESMNEGNQHKKTAGIYYK